MRVAARPAATIESLHRNELEDRSSGEALDYSIIIPVYNRPSEIRVLLHALSEIGKASAHLGRGEILVIDDGSTDDTVAVVESLVPDMSIPTRVVSKPNGGVSSGRNAGFANGHGEIGIVIDSDCIPEPAWLEAMLQAARSDPKLLVFGRIRGGKRPVYPLENLPDQKGFVGASYAMNRRTYLKIGGCYERYGASHDDRDLVLSALAQGCEVAHASEAWIAHPLRHETVRSMWKVGFNSKFGNLYAMRHGAYAARSTRPTPYYFMGIGSNYGSSIAFAVYTANVLVFAYGLISQTKDRLQLVRDFAGGSAAAASLYATALTILGLLTRARLRDLPRYVVTLASFQLSTALGRLQGSREFGIFLL
jgi:glycosyltransferase involved in cell wall biosynthesis